MKKVHFKKCLLCPLCRYILFFIFYYEHFMWVITEYVSEQAIPIEFLWYVRNESSFEVKIILCAVSNVWQKQDLLKHKLFDIPSLRLNFKHLYSSTDHQHCYMISIWWTDWKSLIEVWFHYLLCMCIRTKHDNIEKGTEKGKANIYCFYNIILSFKSIQGVKAHIFFNLISTMWKDSLRC